MKTRLKNIIALGAASASLLALVDGASAQTTIGDPTLTTVFSTVGNGKTPSYTTGSFGVGFDALGGGGRLDGATSLATAQSVYDAFVFDSSAAGVFSTVTAGSKAQIQVFATNDNVNPNANTFDIYASLYAYDPNATAGTVPVTGTNLFGAQQKVVLGQTSGGFFSGDFNLAGALTAGNSYVLGITTLTGDTQDFANVAVSTLSTSGLSGTPTTGDFAFSRNKLVTNANDQGNPAGQSFTVGSNPNVLSFRLLAEPAASPAPEPSQWAAMAFTGLGIAFLAIKRRRSLANS